MGFFVFTTMPGGVFTFFTHPIISSKEQPDKPHNAKGSRWWHLGGLEDQLLVWVLLMKSG